MPRELIHHYLSDAKKEETKSYFEELRESWKELERIREEEEALARLQEANERRRAENEAARQAGQDVPENYRIWDAGEEFIVKDLQDIEYNHATGRVQVQVLYEGEWDPADNPKWEDLTREHTCNPAFRPLVTRKWKWGRGFNAEMLDILEGLDVFVNSNGTVYSEDMEEDDDGDYEERRGRNGRRRARN